MSDSERVEVRNSVEYLTADPPRLVFAVGTLRQNTVQQLATGCSTAHQVPPGGNGKGEQEIFDAEQHNREDKGEDTAPEPGTGTSPNRRCL